MDGPKTSYLSYPTSGAPEKSGKSPTLPPQKPYSPPAIREADIDYSAHTGIRACFENRDPILFVGSAALYVVALKVANWYDAAGAGYDTRLENSNGGGRIKPFYLSKLNSFNQ